MSFMEDKIFDNEFILTQCMVLISQPGKISTWMHFCGMFCDTRGFNPSLLYNKLYSIYSLGDRQCLGKSFVTYVQVA